MEILPTFKKIYLFKGSLLITYFLLFITIFEAQWGQTIKTVYKKKTLFN